MSSQLIPLFNKQTFSFSDLAGDGTLEHVLVKAVDVSDFGDATLLVRVHDKTISGSGAAVEVLVKATAPCAEEPDETFVGTETLARATVSASSGAAGALLTDSVNAPFGGFLQISVKGTQDASPGTVTAELSAELLVRERRSPTPEVTVEPSPVRLCAVADLDPTTDLEAGDSVDGVTLAAGDRVLLVHQTTRAQNGVYVVPTSGAASRAPDWDQSARLLRGRRVCVAEGDYYGKAVFELLSHLPTLGVDAVDWRWMDRAQFSSSNAFYHQSEFCTSGNVWTLAAGGSGSAFQTFAQGVDGFHIGGVALQVSAVNDAAVARWGYTGGKNWYTTTGAACIYDARLKLEDSLPDATNDYEVRVGLLDADIGASTDGWHHELRRVAGNPRWVGITTVGGTQSVVDLCAPTNNWVALEARQNEGATQIDFFVDRVLLGSLTTNIPGVGVVSRPEFAVNKIAGAAQREVSANSFDFIKDYRPPK